MDEIKRKLMALSEGQIYRVPESSVREAIDSETRYMYQFPSADMEMQLWCFENNIAISYQPNDRHFEFMRVANAND